MGNRAKIVIKFVFAAVVFAILALFMDFGSFAIELKKVSTAAVFICVFGEILFYAIESVKLMYLGAFNYSFFVILRSRLLSAFLANFGPGLILGDVLRVFIIDRYRPGNKVYVASMLVSGRLYGVLPLALILPLFAFFHDGIVEKIGLPAVGLAMCAGIGVWASPLLVSHPVLRSLVLSVYRFIKRRAVRKIIRKIFFAFRSFGTAKNWFVASSTSLLTTLIVISEFWILSNAMGLGVSYIEWALLVSVVSIATFLPIGFGAVGSQDAALALLAPYFGQSVESFVALSVLIHIVRVLGTMPGTFFLGEGLGVMRQIRVSS